MLVEMREMWVKFQLLMERERQLIITFGIAESRMKAKQNEYKAKLVSLLSLQFLVTSTFIIYFTGLSFEIIVYIIFESGLDGQRVRPPSCNFLKFLFTV